ncbi:alpha/beta hydrolase [Bacillus sp. BGMRC 2118]|nr:alpha/beta hydrolase [Bacillus sp. BGMRC 2118]
MIERKIQLSNGVSLNTRFTEVEKGKPIVLFIHFSGGTSKMWEGVLPFFEKQYSVIAPDLRGHGKSDKPLAGYHIDDMADDLYLLTNDLGIMDCHVVGSSLGAEVGISLAAKHPELVTSIVCEGAIYNEFGEYGLYNGTTEEIEEEKIKRRVGLSERQLKKYVTKEEFIADHSKDVQELGINNKYFTSFFESCIEEQSDGNYEHFYKNHIRTEYITKYWDLKFEEYYQHVKCPVLFLPSEEEMKDPNIQRSLHYFASLLQHYKIETIENSLHAYVWMQYPEIAAKKVLAFLTCP